MRLLSILRSQKLINPSKCSIFLKSNLKQSDLIIHSRILRFSFSSSFYSTTPINTTIEKTRAPQKPLPELKNQTTQYIIFGIIGVGFWIGAIIASFNYQRLNSSTVQGSLFNLKYHPKALELLGKNINFVSSFPWIEGNINHLKGQINFTNFKLL